MRAAKAGNRYGRLVVMEYRPGTKHRKARVVVRCDCGQVKETWFQPMDRGVVVSCGCHKREAVIMRSTSHGQCGTPEHTAWKAMKQRCFDKRARNFKWYGALGVTVCQRWKDDFLAFLADMGPKPSQQHSIDRIDPSGDYEPRNCRWATKKEQSNNQRRHHA